MVQSNSITSMYCQACHYKQFSRSRGLQKVVALIFKKAIEEFGKSYVSKLNAAYYTVFFIYGIEA